MLFEHTVSLVSRFLEVSNSVDFAVSWSRAMLGHLFGGVTLDMKVENTVLKEIGDVARRKSSPV